MLLNDDAGLSLRVASRGGTIERRPGRQKEGTNMRATSGFTFSGSSPGLCHEISPRGALEPPRLASREAAHPQWAKLITDSQRIKTMRLGGKTYKRIPYGQERDFAEAVAINAENAGACGDCGARPGQFHSAPITCDVEECPRCGRQYLGCRSGGGKCLVIGVGR
jgi:hypothetical protein